MTVSRCWSTRIATVIVLMLVPSLAWEGHHAATPPGPYVLTDLGTLGGLSAQANDLNADAQVVGYATNATSSARPFLWQNGSMTDLGTLGGRSGIAYAVNAFGQAAGSSNVSTSTTHATLWDHGAAIDLTPGAQQSNASGINDSRQVVGTADGKAFVWDNNVLTNLPHLGGGGGTAADINNAGQIVGAAYTTQMTELGPVAHAALWQNGAVTDLGLFPGDEDSHASAINSHGQIVGASGRTDPLTYQSTYRAFLYEGGAMTALPVSSSESYAVDINDSGVIIGTMRTGRGNGFFNYQAFVYAEGVVTDLNSLIPAGSGLHLAFANGINNSGQITGVALDSRGGYHAYLLTPAAAGTPVVNIGDVSVSEGHSGTRPATLTVTVSPASSAPITVTYATGNASAVSGSDYQPASGTVTFEAGQTVKTISVQVNGDRTGEPNETFLVKLASTSGSAIISDGQGVGTIVDDEPRIAITDVAKNEGNSQTNAYTFTIIMSPASDQAVSVSAATANGSAVAGEDYDARSAALLFNPGETSKVFTVQVRGDKQLEQLEVFYVNLSGASGAFVTDNQATGVIRNDDR